MKLIPTSVDGAFLVEFDLHQDSRGSFVRTFCQRDFEEAGLAFHVAQSSLSFSNRKGILRGLHYQAPPFQEVKLVRCVTGAINDVIVDLRADSPTYLQHSSAELSGENGRSFYVPAGCAHGFQVLANGSEVLYQIDQFFSPEHARGVRWNDPVFEIEWPISNPILIERDANYPDYQPMRGHD